MRGEEGKSTGLEMPSKSGGSGVTRARKGGRGNGKEGEGEGREKKGRGGDPSS